MEAEYQLDPSQLEAAVTELHRALTAQAGETQLNDPAHYSFSRGNDERGKARAFMWKYMRPVDKPRITLQHGVQIDRNRTPQFKIHLSTDEIRDIPFNSLFGKRRLGKGENSHPSKSYNSLTIKDFTRTKPLIVIERSLVGDALKYTLRVQEGDWLINPETAHKIAQKYSVRKLRDNQYLDALVSAGIPEEALEGNTELWHELASIEKDGTISANKVYHLQDKEGRRWMLKILNDKQKADFAAAANYHLAPHLEFIVAGKTPAPLEVHGTFLVLQEEIPEQLKVHMPLEYWIAALASFHATAERILREQKVWILEETALKDIDYFREQHDKTKRKTEVRLDTRRIKDSIDYLADAEGRSLIHRDIKRDNLVGPYLVDLDNGSMGHPGIDIAMLLLQYKVPEARWDHYITMYCQARGTSGDITWNRELRKGVHVAAYYMASKEFLGAAERGILQDESHSQAALAEYIVKKGRPDDSRFFLATDTD